MDLHWEMVGVGNHWRLFRKQPPGLSQRGRVKGRGGLKASARSYGGQTGGRLGKLVVASRGELLENESTWRDFWGLPTVGDFFFRFLWCRDWVAFALNKYLAHGSKRGWYGADKICCIYWFIMVCELWYHKGTFLALFTSSWVFLGWIYWHEGMVKVLGTWSQTLRSRIDTCRYESDKSCELVRKVKDGFIAQKYSLSNRKDALRFV